MADTDSRNVLSFGCELELIVAWIYEGDSDPNADDKDLAPILEVPKSVDELLPGNPSDDIYNHIRNTLQKAGLTINDGTLPLPDGVHPQRAEHMFGITVKQDATIAEGTQDKWNGYNFRGVEINSSASWTSPVAFQELELIVEVMRRNYRLRTNQSCGLQFHVGNGLKPLNTQTVKRVAALIWCLDPLACHIHPPQRRRTRYALPIREHSRFATDSGCPDVEGNDIFFADGRIGKSSLWSLTQTTSSRPSRTRQFPASRLSTSRANAATHADLEHIYPDGSGDNDFVDIPVNLDVDSALDGAWRYIACTGTHQIDALMTVTGAGGYKPNYGFQGYEQDQNDLGVDEWVAVPFHDNKLTIEFREAVGSLDPQWINAWGHICAAIVLFAQNASPTKFFGMLIRLAQAQGDFGDPGPAPYDFIDFLDGIGCFAEAELLELKLQDRKLFWFPCRLLPRPHFEAPEDPPRGHRSGYGEGSLPNEGPLRWGSDDESEPDDDESGKGDGWTRPTEWTLVEPAEDASAESGKGKGAVQELGNWDPPRSYPWEYGNEPGIGDRSTQQATERSLVEPAEDVDMESGNTNESTQQATERPLAEPAEDVYMDSGNIEESTQQATDWPPTEFAENIDMGSGNINESTQHPTDRPFPEPAEDVDMDSGNIDESTQQATEQPLAEPAENVYMDSGDIDESNQQATEWPPTESAENIDTESGNWDKTLWRPIEGYGTDSEESVSEAEGIIGDSTSATEDSQRANTELSSSDGPLKNRLDLSGDGREEVSEPTYTESGPALAVPDSPEPIFEDVPPIFEDLSPIFTVTGPMSKNSGPLVLNFGPRVTNFGPMGTGSEPPKPESDPIVAQLRSAIPASAAASSESTPGKSDSDPSIAKSKSSRTETNEGILPAPVPAFTTWLSTFPNGATNLKTSSKGLLCGLYAMRLSIIIQAPDLPKPDIKDMEALLASEEMREFIKLSNEAATKEDELLTTSNLSVDQLAFVLRLWGRQHGWRANLQLGIREASERVWIVPSPDDDRNRRVIWIWNNGAQARGTVAHYEALRPKPLPQSPVLSDYFSVPVGEDTQTQTEVFTQNDFAEVQSMFDAPEEGLADDVSDLAEQNSVQEYIPNAARIEQYMQDIVDDEDISEEE